MAWTKRQILEQAYGELALAGHIFDLGPEELDWARMRLDAMLATWAAQGLNLGYEIALTPGEGGLDEDSGLPLIAVETVFLQLAKRIAAGKGKTLLPTSIASASAAWSALQAWHARQQVRQQGMPGGVPAGAGAKTGLPFLTTTDPGPLRVNGAGGLDFIES